MRKRPEFKPHDEFIFGVKKIGKVTREEFIKYVRNTHENMRKLTQIIQQYEQTIKEWVSKFELFDLAESVRVSNEAERISKDSERDSKIEAVEGVVDDVSGRLDNKANKKQEDWITPTLLNGWTATSSASLQYYKTDTNLVILKGRIIPGTIGQASFVLPAGYRPLTTYSFIITDSAGDTKSMTISNNGNVMVWTSPNAYACFDNVFFRTN